MKKIIAAFLLLSISGGVYAQGITPSQKKIQDELLAKSKSQKTTAYIMLIGGAAAVVGGTVLFGDNFSLLSNESNSEGTAGILLVTAGGASMIGSIFLFSASARNKREAYRITMNIKMEKSLPAFALNRKADYFPAFAVRMTIR